jgi:hypothetical protein
LKSKELTLNEEFELISKELLAHFSCSSLEELARKTGFLQRKSKLKPQDFVSLCTFLNSFSGERTLAQLCSTLDASRHVSMSTEGLNQRFNQSGAELLKEIFTRLLHSKLQANLSLPNQYDLDFYRIRILDSTSWDLQSEYIDAYKGSNGSGLKCQLEYELIKGEILHLDIKNGIENDSKYGKSLLETVKANDLLLRDLGYFSLKDLAKINGKEAFYISRLKSNVRVYRKSNQLEYFKNGKVKENSRFKELNLDDIIDQMKEGEIKEFTHVYMGQQKEYHHPRLIIYKMTDEQLEKRKLKNQKIEKKKGVTQSRRTKKNQVINLYITNIPYQCVENKAIHDLYSLRWQIEILFKTWKSLFHINQIKKMKIERFECHLYGTLISLLLSSTFVFKMREVLYRKKKRQISEYKAMSIIKEYLTVIHEALIDRTKNLKEILKQIYKMIQKNGQKSKRYEKKTVFDILGIIYERNGKLAA